MIAVNILSSFVYPVGSKTREFVENLEKYKEESARVSAFLICGVYDLEPCLFFVVRRRSWRLAIGT